MENKKGNVLKGHHNLAQGKAMGWKVNRTIVRAVKSERDKILFRTKKEIL